MIDEKFLHSEISSRILQAFYTVYNHFRFGFPKSVYEKAMIIELKKLGLDCSSENKEKVYYENQVVGEFETDVIVNKCVAINIDAKEDLDLEDELKIYYFLRTSKLEVGLFLNFGKVPYHRRNFFPNDTNAENKSDK